MTAHELELTDGRRLAWLEYGDPAGFPILNCHGGLVSASDVEPADGEARGLGVRIVSPERPGVGSSTRNPGHSTFDWVADARELMDHLSVERFACMGWSMGGQYCAAVAAAFPERVSRAALIAGCPPLDDPEHFAQLNRMDRRLSRWSLHATPLARATFAAMGVIGRHAPKALSRMSTRQSPELDRAGTRRHPEWPGASMGVALRDTHGMVDEYRAFIAPWGFDLADVGVPVDVWQGTDDELVPFSWAEELVAALPNATLHMVPDAGHMISLTHRRQVMQALLDH